MSAIPNTRLPLRCDLSRVTRGGGTTDRTKTIIVMTTPTPSGRTGEAHGDVCTSSVVATRVRTTARVAARAEAQQVTLLTVVAPAGPRGTRRAAQARESRRSLSPPPRRHQTR
jgi:hypothetical protein